MKERCEQLAIYFVFMCAISASIASSGPTFSTQHAFLARPVTFSLTPKRKIRRFLTKATVVTSVKNVERYRTGLMVFATYLFSIKKGEANPKAGVSMSFAAANEAEFTKKGDSCFNRPALCRWKKKQMFILGENTGNTTLSDIFPRKDTSPTTHMYVELELIGNTSVRGTFNYKFVEEMDGDMDKGDISRLKMSFIFRELVVLK